MSRILIVTTQLDSPVIVSHIESIKNLGHDVSVVTGKDQIHSELKNLETLYFFKKWNFREWLRFLPSFFAVRPQLIHFLIENEKQLTAQKLILELSHSFGVPVFTHFLNLTYLNNKSKNLSFFVYKSDLVTCAHRQSLMGLRGLKTYTPKQIRGLIPPILDMKSKKESSTGIYNDLLSSFLKNNKDPFYVPFKSELFDFETIFGKIIFKILDYKPIIFMGPISHLTTSERKRIHWQLEKHLKNHYPKPKQKWLFYPSLNFASSLDLIPKASHILLAGLPLSIQEISEVFQQAILNKHILIIDEFQAELYSGLWQNKVNCLIVSSYQALKDLDHLLKFNEIETFQLNAIESPNIKSEIIDAPINEFNRLLNKVLSINHEKR